MKRHIFSPRSSFLAFLLFCFTVLVLRATYSTVVSFNSIRPQKPSSSHSALQFQTSFEPLEHVFLHAHYGSSGVFPLLNCSGKRLLVQSGFCDLEGNCRLSGMTVERDPQMIKVLEAIEIRNKIGRVLECSEPSVHFEGHAQKRAYDAFWVTFKLPSNELEELTKSFEENQSLLFHINCFRLSRAFPDPSNPPRPKKNEVLIHDVWVRKRTFVDKVVLLVSQYYSKIPLEWVHAYFVHYFNIGVDYVVLYTAFDPARLTTYSTQLDELVKRFPGRVLRYDWSPMNELDSWAHAQTSMILHGANIFWGAVITVLDLDEIVYFVNGGSMKSLVHDLDLKESSWAYHYMPYTLWTYNPAQVARDACSLNFSTIYRQASPPSHIPQNRSTAGKLFSKYIYRSLEPHRVQVHTVSLETDAKTHSEFILNPADVVMLHVRGLAASGLFKLLPPKFIHGTACDL